MRAELQVRTLFEEAWGEVSHCIDYPRRSQMPMLLQYVSLFTDTASLCESLASAGKLMHEFDGLMVQNGSRARQREKEVCALLLRKLDFLQHVSPSAARLGIRPSQIPAAVALKILRGKTPA